MKKFTEKQIETFMSLINHNILEYMNDNDLVDSLCEIYDKLSKVDEGRYTLSNITMGQVVDEFNSRGENYHLAKELIDDLSNSMKRALLSEYKQYIPKQEVTRKTMIDLLGLRDFATKEEILKELNEIL